MSSDLDQALLLYFDGQQAKTSIQEQQPRKLLDFCKRKFIMLKNAWSLTHFSL
jgi:hypothetical protein